MSTEHLSPLLLDEAAAGLPLGNDAATHLAACADCAERLAALQRANAQLLASSAAQRTLAALAPAPAPAAPRRVPRLALLTATSLALAAGLTLWLRAPAPPAEAETRLKGTVELALLTKDGQPVTHATPGQSLDLALGGAGHTHAVVFALDATGASQRLFDGPLHGGAREKVARLDVTPGDVLVLAFFTDAPTAQPEAELRAALATTTAPLDLAPPGAVRLRLSVP